MPRTLKCFLLVLLLTISFTAQANEWKRHKNTTGNFSALFPGDPQDTLNKNDGGVESHTLMGRQSPAIYTVVYTTMSDEQKVDSATYEVFKNAVFKELPSCTMSADRHAAPDLAGFIGHWYRLNCETKPNPVTIIGNLYWGRHYAYAVMVMFPSSTAEPASTGKFLESFAVLQPGQ